MMSFLYLILAYLAPNHSLIHSSPSGYKALANRIAMLPLSLIIAFFLNKSIVFLNQTSPHITTILHTHGTLGCAKDRSKLVDLLL